MLYARKCAKKCDAIRQLFFKNECIDTTILHYIVYYAFYSWYVVYLTTGTDLVVFVLLDMIYFIVFLVSSTVKVLITKRYSNTIIL